MDLVAAVRAGDNRAYEILFLRYQSRIAAYVRGMVRDAGRAEDITQEVFIAALRRLRATDAPIAFKPWIYEIAKNACIDAFRRTRSTSEVSFDDDEALGAMVSGGGGPDAVVDAKLAIDNLCGAFGGLSQTHHDILVMREFEDLSYREIGERLGMSRAAVESTLFRARRRLSEEYDELVSGERCLRVRAIVDAPPGRAVGVRDQRRMARHVAHCQPCRRHARLAGVDLDAVRAPVAARIAALIPLPAFVRRRFDLDDGSQLFGQHAPSATQWTKVVAVVDPATLSGWPRAIAAAATVAVAGVGAGAAVGERPGHDIAAPAQGVQIAPGLAAQPSASERAPRVTRPTSGRGAAPTGAPVTRSDRGAKERGGGGSADPAPIAATPDPTGSSGFSSEPAARPHRAANGSSAHSDGATLPGAGLPSVDATSRDISTSRPSRQRPDSGLIEGVGSTLGGVHTRLPETLGRVVDVVGTTIGSDGVQGADSAADTVSTTSTPAPATSGTLSTVIGQALGGAG